MVIITFDDKVLAPREGTVRRQHVGMSAYLRGCKMLPVFGCFMIDKEEIV